LDRQQNLLIIDKEKYDSLSWVDQHQTLRTDGSIEYSHRHTVKREAPDLSKVFSTLA
jgi:hypothetical protein